MHKFHNQPKMQFDYKNYVYQTFNKIIKIINFVKKAIQIYFTFKTFCQILRLKAYENIYQFCDISMENIDC